MSKTLHIIGSGLAGSEAAWQAAERGITVADLAIRVHAKMDAYAQLSGALIGRRQAAEDQIDAADALEDLEAIAW